tara:strand:- start:22235 stop:22465 length:231 start_codon:yes stop_codon:yes gene_type:complete
MEQTMIKLKLEQLDEQYKEIDQGFCENEFFDNFSMTYQEGTFQVRALLLKEFILKWHDADTMGWLTMLLEAIETNT